MDGKPDRNYNWPWSKILNEVMVSFQLNKEDCPNILRLKDFKYYPARDDFPVRNEKTRLYLEFAPYGTLDDLRRRYQTRGAYFPELFLWHVFRDLVTAIKVMGVSTFRDPHWREDEDLQAIHLDIKAQNVLLGDGPSDPKAPSKAKWPTIKLADFGTSHITGETDNANPGGYSEQGTPSYMAPVSYLDRYCSFVMQCRDGMGALKLDSKPFAYIVNRAFQYCFFHKLCILRGRSDVAYH